MTEMTDRKQRQREIWEAGRSSALTDAADRIRFQASLAEKFLNAMLIAHGGAIIGLFTFVGNVSSKGDGPLVLGIRSIWAAFACFVLGLALTLAAYLLAFLSQHHFYRQSLHEAERIDRALAMDEPQIDRTKERQSNAAGFRHYSRGLIVAAVSVTLFLLGGGLALFGLLPR
ncbi:hypothetical protein [Sphingobium sp. LSP13-1-1.1]|uniref:hypothetical protein n=1 Tax=Sphingobium sp. LSP13-1-1.1 TaxID=3135234 RepID=UPI00344079FF